MALRFGLKLLAALGERPSSAGGAADLAAAVRARPERFLERLARDYWGSPCPPYRRLLEVASWPPERVRSAVAERGLEPTLEDMARAGVWVSFAEARGTETLQRGGHAVDFAPRDLEAAAAPAVPLSTSGSSGVRSRHPIDVDGLRLQASYMPPMLAALGVERQPVVLYYPAPSAAGIAHAIALAIAGHAPAAWFCHLPPNASRHRRWRFWLAALIVASRLRGVRLPRPRLADHVAPAPLVEWLRRETPHGAVVATFPGSALAVRAFARARDLRLPKITWILGGEPITARKREVLEACGDVVYPWYGAVDAGRIAVGCLRPEVADDMHLLGDRFAAILFDDRLLLTGLDPAVHRRMLNLGIGDRAALSRRSCGCPIEAWAGDWHVHSVRSDEKLTFEGVTLLAAEIQELASDVLPSTCGGMPGDYQLREEEQHDGRTRLVVRVAPELPVRDEAVLDAVTALVARAGGAATAERLLRAGAIAVRREPPQVSAGGKLVALDRR
jgi:hypothetical protein